MGYVSLYVGYFLGTHKHFGLSRTRAQNRSPSALPQDILRSILVLASRNDWKTVSTISLVCRQWRSLARDVPELWTAIPTSNTALVGHFALNSRNLPVDLWMNAPPLRNPDDARLMDLVLYSIVPRIRMLVLDLPSWETMTEYPLFSDSQAPALDTIQIRIPPDATDVLAVNGMFPASCPALKAVTIVNLGPLIDVPGRFLDVPELTLIGARRVWSISTAFRRLTRVRSLVLDSCAEDARWITSGSALVSMPELKDLRIRGDNGRLLQCLTMRIHSSSLESLSVDHVGIQEPEQQTEAEFNHALRSLATSHTLSIDKLRTLRLHARHVDADTISLFLGRVQRLLCLDLYEAYVQSWLDALGDKSGAFYRTDQALPIFECPRLTEVAFNSSQQVPRNRISYLLRQRHSCSVVSPDLEILGKITLACCTYISSFSQLPEGTEVQTIECETGVRSATGLAKWLAER